MHHITAVIFLNRVNCTVAVEGAEDKVFQPPHRVTGVQSADRLLVLAGLGEGPSNNEIQGGQQLLAKVHLVGDQQGVIAGNG